VGALPASAAGAIERLEQLRALAAGLTHRRGRGGAAEGGVDTPADAERAEQD
jgi:CMP-2-keto-3-deoxyoctulosonic acid synthetase